MLKHDWKNLRIGSFKNFEEFILDCLQKRKPNESLKNCNSYTFKYSRIKMHLYKYSTNIQDLDI